MTMISPSSSTSSSSCSLRMSVMGRRPQCYWLILLLQLLVLLSSCQSTTTATAAVADQLVADEQRIGSLLENDKYLTNDVTGDHIVTKTHPERSIRSNGKTHSDNDNVDNSPSTGLRGNHQHEADNVREEKVDDVQSRDRKLLNTLEAGNSSSGKISTRIIGGSDVNSDRFEYYALMRGSYLCGAVLIAPRIVLGAAHCEGAANNFRIGAWDDLQDGSSISISEEVIHPLYSATRFPYDIMLYRLSSSSSNQYIQLLDTPVQNGQQMTVVGFGDTDPTARTEIADQLQEVELEYVDRSTCNAAYGIITDDMICAAGDAVDSCIGDSGGPLLIKGNTAQEDRLAGIVSWGRGCAEEGFPGVYTNVPYFYDWVKDTICTRWPDDAPDYMNCFPTDSPTRSPTPLPTPLPTNVPTSTPPTLPPTVNSNEPSASPSTSTQPTTTIPPTASLSSYVVELVSMSPPDGTLDHCEGNCNGDASCRGNLVCYERTSSAFSDVVPGCNNNESVASDVNVCIDMAIVTSVLGSSGGDWWTPP